MHIGQRLKEARLALGLSQRQLCGDTITRNMLSQIENGVAKPSMETLQFLAKRLGKPMSHFLEETVNPDLQAAREAFRQGAYAEALKALEGCDSQEEECCLLRALSYLQLAEAAVKQGRIPYAISLLEDCDASAEKTAYFVPALHRRRLVLLAKVLPDETEQILKSLPPEDEELILRAQVALHRQESRLAIALLESAQEKGGHWYMLRGRAEFQLEDYAAAVEFFKQAELAGQTAAYGWLEGCYRQLEDYKMAYYYACKQK